MSRRVTKSTLNVKQHRFCVQYAKLLDTTKAAIAVGYAPANAAKQGGQLLSRKDVQREIACQVKQRDLRTEVTGDWVVERLRKLADFNLGRFIHTDANGQPYYDFSQASDDDWYCIGEMTVGTVLRGSGDNRVAVEQIKIKAESKMKALELLAKYTGVVSDKVDLTVLNVHATVDPTDVAAVSALHHQLLALERQQTVIEGTTVDTTDDEAPSLPATATDNGSGAA